jgi:hypothetical protein
MNPDKDSRPFTRIWRSIWADRDFTRLDSDAKVAYFLLISNGDARLTGLMTIAINRWAAQAGMDPARMVGALQALDRAGFVVLDEDTDELLVRTRMRNDTFIGGSWQKQKGALTGACNAISLRIKVALLEEITKLFPLISRPEVKEYADRVAGELDLEIDLEIDPEMDTDPQTHRHTQTGRPADSADPQTHTPADSQTFQPVALGRGVQGGGVASDSEQAAAIKSTEEMLREQYPDDDWDAQ